MNESSHVTLGGLAAARYVEAEIFFTQLLHTDVWLEVKVIILMSLLELSLPTLPPISPIDLSEE